MTARHYMHIAALTSLLGLAGTALADSDTVTRTDSVTQSREAPAAGAIVTPEDKASGMYQDKSGDRNSNADTSTFGDGMSNLGRELNENNTATTAPPRTGSDVQPGDMSPSSTRGE